MGESRRVQRVEKGLRDVISSFLLTGFRHQLPGFVSVPMVRVSADLRNARVYVSVFGAEQEQSAELQKKCVEILNLNRHEVQSHVGKELKMKFCPKLSFFEDEIFQNVLAIEKKLKDLASEKNQDRDKSEEE